MECPSVTSKACRFLNEWKAVFNLYYTFRDGETAWLYARVLGVMRKLTGVSAFSLDPYQIGHENEEGIESGAFWFYRKFGFDRYESSIQRLTRREEEKIASRKNYRTSAATLRRLAEAPMIFELDQIHEGDWDRFQFETLACRTTTEWRTSSTEMRLECDSYAAILCATPQHPVQDVSRSLSPLYCSSRISDSGRIRIKSYCGESSKRRPGTSDVSISSLVAKTLEAPQRDHQVGKQIILDPRDTTRLQPVVFQFHNYNKTNKHTDTTRL
jgi:hypothetical protein